MSVLRPFFFGIIAAALAFFLELVFSFIPSFSFKILFQQASWILVVFVLIEELLKISFVWKNFSVNIERLSKLQVFFQSLLVGLGFALSEAALKALALMPEESGEPISYIPFFGAILIHIGTSGLMGFFLINARKVNLRTFLQILFVAFGWHFLFNFFIINAVSSWMTFLLLLSLNFFIVLAGFKIAKQTRTYTQY